MTFALLTASLLAATSGWSAPGDAAPAALPIPAPPPGKAGGADPQIRHELYTLPNGLQVLLVPDSTVPLVAVSVWYHVGSGHETFGKSGFAHLFEHMLFQGSKNVGMDRHFDILKKAGSSMVNGTTNLDRTNYYAVVPSHHLETALWLESDRMGHLLPLLTTKSLRNQIDVVRNERRQRYDNVPYGLGRMHLASALYPDSHPYRYLTIGRHEDLERASLEDVVAFYKTWYVPANATLAIGGDFDVAATKALVTKWFGAFPASDKPKLLPVPPPVVTARELVQSDALAKLRMLQLAWISPANYAADDAELDLAANALGDEGTGRLYRILVHERQLAQSVSATQLGAGFSGVFSINVMLRPEADVDEVRRLVAQEVERIAREPLGARELARAVIAFESSALYGLEDLLGRVERLQGYNHYLGSPDRMTWDLDRYRTTTAERVRAAVARHLAPTRMVSVLTKPAAAQDKTP
ncbi:MAG: insulinase family protein [Myxococcales bacterium]|nr:insulinase family protein [Myxococcales bacterium]